MFTKPRSATPWLVWLNLLAVGSAAIWAAVAPSEPFPVPGLRKLAAEPWSSWPLFGLLAWIAALHSFEPLRSQYRLVFASGAVAAAAVAVFIFAGAGAFGLILLSASMYRDAQPDR